MRRASCLFLSLLLLLMIFTLAACLERDTLPYIPPVTKLSNNIKITVDPRVELIAIVQYLSQYNQLMTAAEFSYRSDVDTYFHQYRNHEAVTMYDKMTKTGFIFSTPATFALGLTDSLYLDDSVHIADHVVTGGGGKEQLKQFARALREFCRDSKYANFFNAHEDYYRDNLLQVAAILGETDYITELQDYYGMEYQSFTIIPVPLYGGGGGFGPNIERMDRVDAYCILLPFDDETSGDVPVYGNKDVLKLLLRHEFSHSFVNRITNMHMDEVAQYEHLLAPIREEMEDLNYGTWVTCLNEHIVRAVTVRLAYADSPREGSKALDRELSEGFIYTKVLAEALKEYEDNRDTYPDFISFYPRLLEALGKHGDGSAASNASKGESAKANRPQACFCYSPLPARYWASSARRV
ncbi:MAG TPA: DUF4932 domain-containing protein [Bacillota bacterium]|nr:DUF4932 domain-containing protein [Bacillota bacterium]HPZ21407.1 DUF4932 domain-containing protein [Bacillota bacterium]HQD19268.1 DUF4932 domain-containing protein [Bacillota bacterium]